jgi:hypothetical protein
VDTDIHKVKIRWRYQEKKATCKSQRHFRRNHLGKEGKKKRMTEHE